MDCCIQTKLSPLFNGIPFGFLSYLYIVWNIRTVPDGASALGGYTKESLFTSSSTSRVSSDMLKIDAIQCC